MWDKVKDLEWAQWKVLGVPKRLFRVIESEKNKCLIVFFLQLLFWSGGLKFWTHFKKSFFFNFFFYLWPKLRPEINKCWVKFCQGEGPILLHSLEHTSARCWHSWVKWWDERDGSSDYDNGNLKPKDFAFAPHQKFFGPEWLGFIKGNILVGQLFRSYRWSYKSWHQSHTWFALVNNHYVLCCEKKGTPTLPAMVKIQRQ